MKKILVIEDANDIREEILETLQLENFEVAGAPDGLIGLQMAREFAPDLIVCDIIMPGLNGYEVLQELRQDSSTATIPFIFLTALTARDAMRKGMELGADDFISKPFTVRELLNAIRARFDKQITLENQHLRTHAQHLVKSQEAERQRIAYELHEEIGQVLTSLKFVLGMSKRLPVEEIKPKLGEAQALVHELIHRVAELSNELRPTMLDDLGLLPTLLHHFERYTDQTSVRVNFEHRGLDTRFTPEIETAVYRIIQEALLNVARHTTITDVNVQIWQDSEVLNIRVEDTGEGFEVGRALNTSVGNGLVGMQERVISLNGKLTILSAPQQGTQILAQIPIHSASEAELPPFFPLEHALPLKNAAPSSQTSIRIVLADRQELLRQGLKSILQAVHQFSVVGETASFDGIASLLKQHQPEILIFERGIGLDIIQYKENLSPETRVLVLSRHANEAYVVESFQKGADGYLLKESSGDELVQAVQEILSGKRYLSKTLSERVIDFYAKTRQAENETLNAYQTLTEREREIFKLVAEGYKNTEIAELLTISSRTVETHRANFMRKLNLHNPSELIRYAIEQGIISPRR